MQNFDTTTQFENFRLGDLYAPCFHPNRLAVKRYV